MDAENGGDRFSTFTRRVLLVVGISVLVFALLTLLWQAADVLVLLFAGILLAIFLRGLSGWIGSLTGLSGGWSLALTLFVLVGVIVAASWLIGPRLAAQFDKIAETLPRSVERLRQRVDQYGAGSWLLEQTPEDMSDLLPERNLFGRVTGIFSRLFDFISQVVVILFTGVYLAADPRLYRRGLILLVPQAHEARAREVLGRLGYVLRWWVIGQLISMAVIGAATTLGLWLIGMPLAVSLGLIAGFSEIVPVLGPLVAFVLAILIALALDPQAALYVALLYVVIQAIESYVLVPLVQKKAVSLPPAVTITSVVLAGVLFGFLGVLVAAPLAVSIMVIVKMLYVEDALGKRVTLPGGSDAAEAVDT